MSSVFFQISNKEFLQALKIYDNPGKEFALRIISFHNGLENYTHLPDVTLNELSVLASILGLRMIPNLKHTGDLRNYLYHGSTYYYY